MFAKTPRACLLLVAFLVAAAPVLRAEDTVGTEPPGFHGMLVVGAETIYMAHLPMFVPKHRYQGLWEVSFGEAADQQYREERLRPENAGRIFTLAPLEDFRLPELGTSRGSFRAALFIGHFERDGREVLLEDVTVTLKRRIHWHPFRNRHTRPAAASYVLFGEGDETWASHWIVEAPSYHQILAVTVAEPIAESLEGVQVVLSEQPDGTPLQAGESVTGLGILNGDPEQPIRIRKMELRVDSVFFLEQGELAKSSLPDDEPG